MAGLGVAVVDDAAIPIGLRLRIIAPLRQARQPFGIGGAAVNHGLKQAQGNPFVPIRVAGLDFALLGVKFALKALCGFADVVQQRRQGGHDLDAVGVVTAVFGLGTQNIAAGAVGGHAALFVELAPIAHNPQQFGVVFAVRPVAGHGGVFARALAQQLA